MAKFPIVCVAGAALLMAGCVSQQEYNESQRRNAELEQEYRQLNQTMSAEVAAHNVQISRMQDAIKVSINSELQFPPGGWKCRTRPGRTSPRSQRSWHRIRLRRST
jgi:chemotaxis protein MotB